MAANLERHKLPQRKINADKVARNRLERRTRLLVRSYHTLQLSAAPVPDYVSELIHDIKIELMERP